MARKKREPQLDPDNPYHVELIRERLTRYVEDRDLFWSDVAERVRTVTGVLYPGESIRQGVISKNAAEGEPPRAIEPERLRALYSFLRDENLIDPIELMELPIFEPAAQTLMRFIAGSGKPYDATHFDRLRGTFEAVDESGDAFEFITFIVLPLRHLVHVSEICMRDAGEDEFENDVIVYQGWAVGQPGQYVFVLRSEPGEVRWYLMAEAAPADPEAEIDHFALLKY